MILIVGDDKEIDEREERIENVYADIFLSCPNQWDESSEPEEPVEPVLDPIEEEELGNLNKKDGPGLSLLKGAHESLEELKQTAHRKFDSVLESLSS